MIKQTRITLALMRTLQANGRSQSFPDAHMAGLTVMVSPKGRISFIYRYQKPNGTRGRLLLGHWPEMRPKEARAAVEEFRQRKPTFSRRLRNDLCRELIYAQASEALKPLKGPADVARSYVYLASPPRTTRRP